jgi:hypothetical protein
MYELKNLIKLASRVFLTYLFDLFLFFLIFSPIFALPLCDNPNIIQLYSYGNLTKTFVKLVSIWLIMSNLMRIEIKRSYTPFFLLILHLFIIR